MRDCTTTTKYNEVGTETQIYYIPHEERTDTKDTTHTSEIERLQSIIEELVANNRYLSSMLQRASNDSDLATNRLRVANKMEFEQAQAILALKKQLSERDKKINTYKVCVMQQQECITKLKAQIKGMGKEISRYEKQTT